MSEAGSTEKQKEEAMQLLAQQHEEIDKYAKAAQEELENKQKLEMKLKALEQRVVHGGENMVEKMSELKKLAKATKAELEVQRYDCGPGMAPGCYLRPTGYEQYYKISVLYMTRGPSCKGLHMVGPRQWFPYR